MLPLGIIYFIIAVFSLSVSLAFLFAPLAYLFGDAGEMAFTFNGIAVIDQPWLIVPMFIGGALGVFITLHIARGIGKLHGMMAKHLLVKIA